MEQRKWTAAPTSVVDTADIGRGTRIWGQSEVRAGARIGEDCIVGRNVFIDADVHIGDRCKIQNNALVYGPARIGNGVFIGPGAVLTNDRSPRAVNPDLSLKRSGDWVQEGVTIEQGASLGAHTTVLAGVCIGEWALIAAGAVVTSNVSHRALMAGVPALLVAWVDKSGTQMAKDGAGLFVDPSGQTWRQTQEGTLIEATA